MAWLDEVGLAYLISKLKSNNSSKLSEARYTYTTPSSQTVSFTVPDFSADTCTLDVYINGLHAILSVDYTVNGNVVTMVNQLDANQVCEFVVRRVV